MPDNKDPRAAKPRKRVTAKRKSRRSSVAATLFELPPLYHIEVADTLDHVSKIVARAIGEIAREVDATHGQLQVITAVARSPEGLTARQVADALAIRPGSLTGMLDQLERRGAIARNPVPGDARQQMIVLRPGAKELIDALDRADRQVAVLLEPLDADSIRRLGETVVRLEDAMRADISQPLPESLRFTSPEGIRKPKLRDDDPDNPDATFGGTVPAASGAEEPEAPSEKTPAYPPPSYERQSVARSSPAEPEHGWRRGFTIASKVISAVDSVRRRRDE